MINQTNKKLFIDLLAANLKDNEDRQRLLNLAGEIIPNAEDWHSVAYDNPHVQKAIRGYKRFHPDYKDSNPPIEVVMEWMFKRGPFSYVERLERQMKRIQDVLDELGTIDMDSKVPVSASQIIAMRIISQLDPLVED
jgi:hypothetical protein